MIAYIVSLFAGVGLWTALGVTLIAGLMRGFAGFGSAMLMAPIFAILFGSAEMVVTVVAIELVVSLQLFPQVRRHADWRLLAPLSLAACAPLPGGRRPGAPAAGPPRRGASGGGPASPGPPWCGGCRG